MWLIDYQQIFKNKKYLIKASQVRTDYNESQDITDFLSDLQTNINNKFDNLLQ